MADNYIQGTGDDGEDLDPGGFHAKFMASLRARQEAVWGVVAQGRVVIATEAVHDAFEGTQDIRATDCVVYITEKWRSWWEKNHETCWSTLVDTAETVLHLDVGFHLKEEWLLDVPPDLVHFVAENTGRPKPRRYNNTAVPLTERDGVAWLTPPEVKLYDALKETNWLFIPQPPFLSGEGFDRRPDFLIYWKNKAQCPVIIGVDSDAHHPPSKREVDEARERQFQSRGFQFFRYSATRVNKDVQGVIRDIAEHCTRMWGPL